MEALSHVQSLLSRGGGLGGRFGHVLVPQVITVKVGEGVVLAWGGVLGAKWGCVVLFEVCGYAGDVNLLVSTLPTRIGRAVSGLSPAVHQGATHQNHRDGDKFEALVAAPLGGVGWGLGRGGEAKLALRTSLGWPGAAG